MYFDDMLKLNDRIVLPGDPNHPLVKENPHLTNVLMGDTIALWLYPHGRVEIKCIDQLKNNWGLFEIVSGQQDIRTYEEIIGKR